MSKVKAGGTSKNLRDSGPQYLGIKISDGQAAKSGSIIVRQRGSRYYAGEGVGTGRDYSLFALKDGVVKFGSKRKGTYDGKTKTVKTVSVV